MINRIMQGLLAVALTHLLLPHFTGIVWSTYTMITTFSSIMVLVVLRDGFKWKAGSKPFCVVYLLIAVLLVLRHVGEYIIRVNGG